MESGCYMALNMITTTMDWNVRRGARYLGRYSSIADRAIAIPTKNPTRYLPPPPPSSSITTCTSELYSHSSCPGHYCRPTAHCSVVIDTPPCALHVHVHDRLRETGDDSRGNTVAAIRHLRTTRVCASDIPTAAVANSRRRADTRDTHSAKAFAEPARGRDQKATMNVNGNAPSSCIPARS